MSPRVSDNAANGLTAATQPGRRRPDYLRGTNRIEAASSKLCSGVPERCFWKRRSPSSRSLPLYDDCGTLRSAVALDLLLDRILASHPSFDVINVCQRAALPPPMLAIYRR